ncbi:hypothetical protein BDY19DRAFT_639479 [Irpex rosettiformis]|uniref:Uncharacterized protein n=1 Tax=Irpex rosettiformis TaxID=378272 RepID=A0ACB8UBF0_9APHY|nr:hypothetical protein BDY19DRAFT_639479 [Irpex rosettiformis]
MLFLDERHTNHILSARDVDVAISRIAEISRELRSTRNSFASINCLPLEILSEIFLCLQTSDSAIFTPLLFREWLQVIHVCRHWRKVAHGCALLWTKIDVCAPQELVKEMLERSRNAGLEVKAILSRASSRTLSNWASIIVHSRRIRTLHLGVDDATCNQLLRRTVLEVDMPRLESFRVNSTTHAPLHLSSRLFSKGAPCLQHLELCDSFIPWDMPFLLKCPRLKTFTVRNVPPPPTIGHLFYILQSIPALEELNMSQLSHITPEPSVPLQLQHLCSLVVSEAASKVFSLTKPIGIPGSITTSSHLDPYDTEDRSSGLSILFDAIFNNRDSPFKDLHIDAAALSCRMRPSRNASSKVTSYFPVHMSLQGSISLQGLIDLVLPLPLRHVTSFTLEDRRATCGRDLLPALLQAMPQVQTLHVYHKASLAVLYSLCTDAELELLETTSSATLLLPQLEHLILEDVDMSWAVDRANILIRLQEMQFLRSNRGRPIAELTIAACRNVTAEEINVLCHIFVDVDWDGFKSSATDANDEDSNWEATGEAEEDPELWEIWEGNNVGWHS